MSYQDSLYRLMGFLMPHSKRNPVGVMRRLPYHQFRRPKIRQGFYKGNWMKWRNRQLGLDES